MTTGGSTIFDTLQELLNLSMTEEISKFLHNNDSALKNNPPDKHIKKVEVSRKSNKKRKEKPNKKVDINSIDSKIIENIIKKYLKEHLKIDWKQRKGDYYDNRWFLALYDKDEEISESIKGLNL